MLLILSGQPCLLCAPCVHRPLSASSGFWSLFSSTPPATNKNIPLSSFNWHWHWHLDGTDDSEVFHNVILMSVYRVKDFHWKSYWRQVKVKVWIVTIERERQWQVSESSGLFLTWRHDCATWRRRQPILELADCLSEASEQFSFQCVSKPWGGLYLGQGGWGWKTCAGVSATMPCAVTSKVG